MFQDTSSSGLLNQSTQLLHSHKDTPLEQIHQASGPFIITERLIQQIWTNQEFQKDRLYTLEGSKIEILNPGIWNKMAGPDFKEAQVSLGGHLIRGDIEIHVYRGDWFKHAHHHDRAYDRVIVDVVLFDLPEFSSPPIHSPETLVLLPHLYKPLEEYAQEYALLALEKRENLGLLLQVLEGDMHFRWYQLRERALMRWKQKCFYAQKNLKEQGWVEACHHYFLQVLGYRHNKVPMALLAHENSYESLLREPWVPENLYERYRSHWKLQGTRPNNRPLIRLTQYKKLLELSPTWPHQLQLLAEELALRANDTRYIALEGMSAHCRKFLNIAALRSEIADDILGNVITSTRLDNWVVDAFLPLASVYTKQDLFKYWFYWLGADIPDCIQEFIRQLGIQDSSNGLNQGVLQLAIEKGLY